MFRSCPGFGDEAGEKPAGCGKVPTEEAEFDRDATEGVYRAKDGKVQAIGGTGKTAEGSGHDLHAIKVKIK